MGKDNSEDKDPFDEFNWQLPADEARKMYGEKFDPTKEETKKEEIKRDNLIYGKDVSRNWTKIRVWDDIVGTPDKKKINMASYSSDPTRKMCPLLIQPRRANYFFYCAQKAAEAVKDPVRKIVYTALPSVNSAQVMGYMSAETLESTCTKEDCWNVCERFLKKLESEK